MRRRIFIAINLPEEVKKELSDYQKKWPSLPVKWTKKDNLHITLEFLGYIADEELLEACQKVMELASKHKPFSITLNKICYGPINKKPPRMIWAVGKKIKEFDLLPHITLGRINTWEWRRIEPEEMEQVDEDIDIAFDIKSIEVMESVLKRGGPEYTVLKSYLLS